MMELHRPHIVQMAVKRKQAASVLRSDICAKHEYNHHPVTTSTHPRHAACNRRLQSQAALDSGGNARHARALSQIVRTPCPHVYMRPTCLRAPRNGPPEPPSDSSIAVRCHCAAQQPTTVAWDGMPGLPAVRIAFRCSAARRRTLHAVAFRFKLCEHHRHGGKRLFQARRAG